MGGLKVIEISSCLCRSIRQTFNMHLLLALSQHRKAPVTRDQHADSTEFVMATVMGDPDFSVLILYAASSKFS